MNKIQNRIDANNKLFQIIKQDTKIDDLEEIADIFENYKDTNETLYKQVNDCSKEEIELEKQIEVLEIDILKMSAQQLGVDFFKVDKIKKDDFRKQDQQKIEQVLLKEEMVKIKIEEDVIQKEMKESQKNMKDIRSGLKLLFNKLGCNNEQNKYLASEEITNQNLYKYLDIAGRRAHNIILMHEFITEEEILPLQSPTQTDSTPEKYEEEKSEG